MSQPSITPDFTALEIAQDSWSAPFWAAGTEGRLLMPRCVRCGTFRWPAGPFCPKCHTQPVDWMPPGQARAYSFTIMPVRGADPEAPPQKRIAMLASFDDAPGVRLVSVLVDAVPEEVAIDAPLGVEWQPAANGVVPVFRLA